ncbi:hypothetical protein Ancab_020530 [Ancistrocladus abbreviatus]
MFDSRNNILDLGSQKAPALSLSGKMVTGQQISTKPWIVELVPLLVVILIVAHVFALVYWIYRVATEKQPQTQRTKKH